MLLAIFTFLIMVFLLYLLSGYLLACLVIYPRTLSLPASRDLELKYHRLEIEWFEGLPREEVHLESPHAYPLYGWYLPYPGSRRTVIISHGITHSLYGAIKYGPIFQRLGCNVLLYDLRHHGRSGGDSTTFGFYEKDDLHVMVDWAFERLGRAGKVGTLGESLGAAITLLEAIEDKRLSFVIADCPFSDLHALLRYRMRIQLPWLPAPLFLPLAEWYCARLTGMTLAAVSPLTRIETLASPLLLVHGMEDRYIPAAMSQALYQAKTEGICQVYLAPDARHAESILKNPQEYTRRVVRFLEETGFNG